MNEDAEHEYLNLVGDEHPLSVIKRLAETYNENCYDIGCVLYYLKENDIYKTIDGNKYYSDKHNKWKQFCSENLSISYRTAQYWLNLYRYFIVDMGMSKAQLLELGWSKAKELIDVTDDVSELEKILSRAKDMTIGELQAFIVDYEETHNTETEVTKFKKFSFSLPATQSEHAEEIIRLASSSCKGDLNEGFWKVLVEWFQITNPIAPEDHNTFLVSESTLDDNGQELPPELMEII